jgi:hypothetical protein
MNNDKKKKISNIELIDAIAKIKIKIKHNNTKIDEYLSKNVVNEKEKNRMLLSKIINTNDQLFNSILLKQQKHKKINNLKNITKIEHFNENNNYKFVVANQYHYCTPNKDTSISTNIMLNNIEKNVIEINLEPDIHIKKINNLSCKIIKINTGSCVIKTNYLPNSVKHLITKNSKNIFSYLNNSLIILNLDKITSQYGATTACYNYKKMPIHIKKIYFNDSQYAPVLLKSNKKYKKVLCSYKNYVCKSTSSDLYLLFMDNYDYDDEKKFFIKEEIE